MTFKPADFTKCTKKRKCCNGPNVGTVYEADDPCQVGYAFNEATCDCEESCDPNGYYYRWDVRARLKDAFAYNGNTCGYLDMGGWLETQGIAGSSPPEVTAINDHEHGACNGSCSGIKGTRCKRSPTDNLVAQLVIDTNQGTCEGPGGVNIVWSIPRPFGHSYAPSHVNYNDTWEWEIVATRVRNPQNGQWYLLGPGLSYPVPPDYPFDPADID